MELSKEFFLKNDFYKILRVVCHRKYLIHLKCFLVGVRYILNISKKINSGNINTFVFHIGRYEDLFVTHHTHTPTHARVC